MNNHPVSDPVPATDPERDYAHRLANEGLALLFGARSESYGHPEQSWTQIGRSWAALLSTSLRIDVPDVPPETVGLMMDALKSHRQLVRHKDDNLVDKHGFTVGVSRIMHRRGV